MSEQRKKILDMVAQGKLTPEEADRLLGAIKESHERARCKEIALDEFSPEMLDEIVESFNEGGRFKLVEVTDEEKGEFVEVYIE